VALSDYYDDLSHSYYMTADQDRSLGGLAIDLGEKALASGDWTEAMQDFGEGAQYYADAAVALDTAAIFQSIATALRAAGR
jgi:hypothetical protein